jgi:hypothetical protein
MNTRSPADSVNESLEQKALILGGFVSVIAANIFVFLFFHYDKRANPDIWMLVLFFCIISITVFAVSYILFRHIMKKRSCQNEDSVFSPLSVFAYLFRQRPAVKGIIALGIAILGLALFVSFSQNGMAWREVIFCSLFGIPLVAFLNNTFGKRRNEMCVVTLYITLIVFIFAILFFWPLVFTGDQSNPVAWGWLLVAFIILVVFILMFYPNLFSLTGQTQHDPLEQVFFIHQPQESAFKLCIQVVQLTFPVKNISPNHYTKTIDLQEGWSHFTVMIEEADEQKSRVTVKQGNTGYLDTWNFFRTRNIRTFNRICQSIIEHDDETLGSTNVQKEKTVF